MASAISENLIEHVTTHELRSVRKGMRGLFIPTLLVSTANTTPSEDSKQNRRATYVLSYSPDKLKFCFPHTHTCSNKGPSGTWCCWLHY